VHFAVAVVAPPGLANDSRGRSRRPMWMDEILTTAGQVDVVVRETDDTDDGSLTKTKTLSAAGISLRTAERYEDLAFGRLFYLA
jgi:hypothetical protein